MLAFVSLRGEAQPAAPVPEDVVAQLIEASNARDADALAALYDPDVFHSYNASQLGSTEFNTKRTGRDNVMELIVGYVWPN